SSRRRKPRCARASRASSARRRDLALRITGASSYLVAARDVVSVPRPDPSSTVSKESFLPARVDRLVIAASRYRTHGWSVVGAYRISIAAQIKVENARSIFQKRVGKNRKRISTTIVASVFEWVLSRGGGWMRVLTWSGTMCPVVTLLACAVGFGSVTTRLVATARAQTIPKALEDSGTDNAIR